MEGGKGGVDIGFGAGLEDFNLDAFGARCLLRISDRDLVDIFRIHQKAYYLGLRDQVGQQVDPLLRQLVEQDADAGEVAAWSRQTGCETLRSEEHTSELQSRFGISYA